MLVMYRSIRNIRRAQSRSKLTCRGRRSLKSPVPWLGIFWNGRRPGSEWRDRHTPSVLGLWPSDPSEVEQRYGVFSRRCHRIE